MVMYRTVILEAHDGSRWRSLSQLPTTDQPQLNQHLLWENPSWKPLPKKPEDFPPIPDDCSERVKSRLKGVAYFVKTCLDFASFERGVEKVASACQDCHGQALIEMRGALAMAKVLSEGNIPVRFIVLLDY